MKKGHYIFLACFLAVPLVAASFSACRSKPKQTKEAQTTSAVTTVSETAADTQEETTTAPVQNNTDKPNDNQTTSKPSGGGNATKPNTPPPTTSKPQEPATPPTTSAPKPTEPEAPAGFAMTPEEIIAYANSICDSYGRLHYYEDMSKETDAWNVPGEIYPEDSVATIKKQFREKLLPLIEGIDIMTIRYM